MSGVGVVGASAVGVRLGRHGGQQALPGWLIESSPHGRELGKSGCVVTGHGKAGMIGELADARHSRGNRCQRHGEKGLKAAICG